MRTIKASWLGAKMKAATIVIVLASCNTRIRLAKATTTS